MIRPVLTELLLLATPFVLYAVFLWATKAGVMDPESWPVSRIVWLAGVALMLVLGSFLYFANYKGSKPGGRYVPAHVEDGKFVPGRTVYEPEPPK
jgi:hypothetical protein